MAAWSSHLARASSRGTPACIVTNLLLGFFAGVSVSRALVPALLAAAQKLRRRRRLLKAPLPAITTRDKLTLKYFDIPALAEPIRVLLALGHFEWEDRRVAFDAWPALKEKTKWGQVPVLVSERTGAELTQCKSICRYLAKLTKIKNQPLYPCDDAALAFAIDELIDTFEDVRSKIMPTMRIQDQAEKEKARRRLFAPDGDCTALLRKIDRAVGSRGFAIGDGLTLADVWCYFFANLLRCGFMEGIPFDCMDSHCNLVKIVQNVASLPEVKAHYEAEVKRGNTFCVAFLDPPRAEKSATIGAAAAAAAALSSSSSSSVMVVPDDRVHTLEHHHHRGTTTPHEEQKNGATKMAATTHGG